MKANGSALLCGDLVSVDICANLEREPRTGCVILAGELLTSDDARALAEKWSRAAERLLRAADQLDALLAIRSVA